MGLSALGILGALPGLACRQSTDWYHSTGRLQNGCWHHTYGKHVQTGCLPLLATPQRAACSAVWRAPFIIPKMYAGQFGFRANVADPSIPLASILLECTLVGFFQEGVHQLLLRSFASFRKVRLALLKLAQCFHAVHFDPRVIPNCCFIAQ